MIRTLRTHIHPSVSSSTALADNEPERPPRKLNHLLREMDPALRQASEDLLQPREKAVVALLEQLTKPT